MDGHSRKIAAMSLSGSDNLSIVPILKEVILKEEYRDVMNVMCDSLASIKTPEVKDFFINLLDNKNDVLKQIAARGLGSIGGEDILQNLMAKVENNIPTVRKAVLVAMSALGLPEGLDRVIAGLKDEDVDVRLSVLKCINSWDGSFHIGQDKLISALIDSLADENMWVRYQAVSELGKLKIQSAEDAILDILNEDLPPVKCSAIRALVSLGSTKAIDLLNELINDEDEKVSQSARKAIGDLS